LFLLAAFGPLEVDKPRPSKLVSPVVRAEALAAVYAEECGLTNELPQWVVAQRRAATHLPILSGGPR